MIGRYAAVTVPVLAVDPEHSGRGRTEIGQANDPGAVNSQRRATAVGARKCAVCMFSTKSRGTQNNSGAARLDHKVGGSSSSRRTAKGIAVWAVGEMAAELSRQLPGPPGIALRSNNMRSPISYVAAVDGSPPGVSSWRVGTLKSRSPAPRVSCRGSKAVGRRLFNPGNRNLAGPPSRLQPIGVDHERSTGLGDLGEAADGEGFSLGFSEPTAYAGWHRWFRCRRARADHGAVTKPDTMVVEGR